MRPAGPGRTASLLVLVLAIGALPLGAAPPAVREVDLLLRSRPGVASPIEGFLTIAHFHERSGRLDRAYSTYLYALSYVPDDGRLMARLAWLALRLGDGPRAREWALAARASPNPGPEAERVLLELESAGAAAGLSPSPAASTSATAGPVGSPTGGAGPTASAVASAGPTPVATAGASPAARAAPSAEAWPRRALLVRLARLLKLPDPEVLRAAMLAPPRLDPKKPADQLAVLSMLKAIDGALKAWLAADPKGREKLEAFDPKPLKDARLLPRDLDLSAYPPVSIDKDSKAASMEGFGTVESLEGAIKDYKAGLDQAARHLGERLPGEALRVLEGLASKYPDDSEVLVRLVDVASRMAMASRALEAARRLAAGHPYGPGAVLSVARTALAAGRTDLAREAAQLVCGLWPVSPAALAGRAILELAARGVSPAVLAPSPAPPR